MKVTPDQLNDKSLITLAYYFPQYYPIPENNSAFCDGFTDWFCFDNLPDKNAWGYPIKHPSSLGRYDTRDKEVRAKQTELAHQYGIDGFVYYHYWHESGPVMTKMLETILADGQPDLPFAFCWDNNHWVARYAARFNPNMGDADSEQVTSKTTLSQPERHAAFLLPYFQNKNYIRVDDKPMFIIYRWDNVAVMNRYIKELLAALAKEGLTQGLHLVQCLCGYDTPNPYTETIGPHAYQPFAPNFSDSIALKKGNQGRVYTDIIATRQHFKIDKRALLYCGGLTGWDNSPRYHLHRVKQPVFYPSDWSVDKFEEVTKSRFNAVLADPNPKGTPNFYFFFAWNEWGEGATLEPNSVTGDGLGMAVKNALFEILNKTSQ